MYVYVYIYIYTYKSPDEWATMKQVCRDELVVYLSFSSHNIHTHTHTYIYIYVCIYMYVCVCIYMYILKQPLTSVLLASNGLPLHSLVKIY